ncbi:MAG: hypothetical protein K6E59_04155 [Bacilli bacterium]|nr:hypothetical protein [Bacilli bacterium]
MSEEQEKSFVPYDRTHRLRPLLFVTTIVPDGQAESILQLNYDCESALCCVCHGHGTAPAEILSILSVSPKKDVVFSVLRLEFWEKYKDALRQRFSVSAMAKGIAYSVPLDSVAGISIYKMLSNTRLFEKPISPTEKKGKKE